MSIIIIIPADDKVSIDGEAETVIFTGNPNIHSVRWDTVSETGEVEYDNRASEEIDNFTPYQHVIADHGNSKAAREQAAIDEAAAIEAALTPQQRRAREYPPSPDHLYALHEARQGDSTALDAVDALYIATDAKYPLS